MNTKNLVMVLILALLLSACDDTPTHSDESDQVVTEYTCPMHPHYISTDPDGACPICGMDLVPASRNDQPDTQGVQDGATTEPVSVAPTHSDESQQVEAKYTCPMHPHYISTDPDGSCPICGMDLVPVSRNDQPDALSEQDNAIVVSDTMIQTMGVRTSRAEIIEFGRTLRAFGTVEADERLANVSVSRLEGWIDGLSVRAEGDAVSAGDLLYRVYSPELISAQRDYVSALASTNVTRIASVKQRLTSIGMQEQPLRQLTQRKTVLDKVPVYAETDGIVAELNVRNGDYLKPGTPILRLQSYSKVWVIASIPETDLPLINRGLAASLRFPSAPNAPSIGKVDYIYPTIDAKTRTAKVRLELDNASGDLQPGAYADITLSFAKQARLSIVSEAILRDSRGDHVILDLGAGRFGTRSVTTGITAAGRTEILAGLQAGERVVASGQFMLDSEVNLREGLSKLATPLSPPAIDLDREPKSPIGMQMGQQSNDTTVPLAALDLDAASLAQVDHFIDMALYFYSALINAEAIDPRFVDPAIALADVLEKRYAESALVPILRQSKNALITAQASLESQALAADLASLMQALKPWLVDGAPQHYSDLGLTLYRDLATGRLWLQKSVPGSDLGQSPYGEGAFEVIVWPELHTNSSSDAAEEATTMPNAPTMPSADPHAGHR